MSFDADLSAKVARRTRPSLKRCWENAVRALRRCGKLLPEAVYVEGWIVNRNYGWPVAVEHGWLETSDGKIVDPTITLLQDWQQIERAYFPGIRWTRAEVDEAFANGEKPVFAWRFGWGGFQHAGYNAAHDAAVAYMEECIRKSQAAP